MTYVARLMIVIALAGTVVTACTAREMASGAAGAGAGYLIGKEAHEDDD